MTSQNNYFPQQQTAPDASVSGNMNMPSPVPYPQQSAYNPYYPQQQGSYYPQQPGPSVYGPTPYGPPGQYPSTGMQVNVQPTQLPPPQVRPNVQVNVQSAVSSPIIVHEEKVI